MNRKMKSAIALTAIVGSFALMGSACSDTAKPATRSDQLEQNEQGFDDRQPPQVTGDAEYNNYIRAQEEVYDDPSSIIWCTVYPENPSAPIFTVPVAGKLTSSSVSYFPNQTFARGDLGEYDGDFLVEAQSVDGMYHGTPPAYRYGFTPGGQYVDFANLPTFCTTSLTEFQRQTLKVAAVSDDGVTQAAEDALKAGDAEKAQEIVDGAAE